MVNGFAASGPESRKGKLGRLLASNNPLVLIARALVRQWRRDKVGSVAAEIAFFGVLSLFPSLLAIAATLGFLDAILGSDLAARSRDEILRFLGQLFTSRADPLLEDLRVLFEERSPGLLSFATAAALWAASRGSLAAIRGLNLAYRKSPERSWIWTRAKALAMAVGSILAAVCLLAILVLGPLLGAGQALASSLDSPAAGRMLMLLRYPVAFLVVVGWASAVFHFAPNHRPPWRAQLPGAAATALIALAASAALSLYLSIGGGANTVLGVLGGPLILMVWLYLLSIALLLGAEINELLMRSTPGAATKSGPARRAGSLLSRGSGS